ncbi:sulfate adenylyltransferase subunit CysD [Gammaproteobacteria bacterium]|nr:sulfate adenylyltransferase subunit CysD [Gammaproteobacteria bacterium]
MYLKSLEAESIYIFREVIAECNNPVMLYSIGKDSSVMLHLARKSFYPSPIPFPLLHIDTKWKFKEMISFRDKTAIDLGLNLITHTSKIGLQEKISPFTHGSAIYTDIMKTAALKEALDYHKFDAAFGGARRDEEKSRAKERIFSFRDKNHRWDPKNQRPELWSLYNTKTHKDESIRVFPISNWTELDIWQYIEQERIPVVPLYFAAKRPVVKRNEGLIMVDDDRIPLQQNEHPTLRQVRFRTLGCYPLTLAIESNAKTVKDILLELKQSKLSERQGRVIDNDGNASMQRKKEEGYF